MKFPSRLYAAIAFAILGHLAACMTIPENTPSNIPARSVLIGQAYAYDGDSVFFGTIEVRLEGIDAPELQQACRDDTGAFWPCGVTARSALRRMMKAASLECRLKGRDKYRRLLGVCYAQGRDLNAAMVASGNAIAYRHFSRAYVPQETQARAERRGIWRDAHFTEPYFCRHLTPDHVCYRYDLAAGTGREATRPLTGKSPRSVADD